MEGPANGAEFLAELRKRGERKKPNFRDLSRFFDQKARQKGIPISGQFELTPLCNLNCRMCYVHLDPGQLRGRSVLSVSEWKDLMTQAFQAGMIRTTLTGGECLAYPGFDELYLFLHSLGCEVTVLTNGVLLDEKRIQFFREHRPADIQITLYGWNDDVYERVTGRRVFETIERNIRMILEAKLSLTLTITPNVYLGEDTLETVRLARSFTRNVVINPMVFPPREETGRAEQADDPELDLYVRIYQLMDKLDGQNPREIPPDKRPAPGGPCRNCPDFGIQCAAGRSFFSVDWKGNMQPCNSLGMVQEHPFEEGFKVAWTKVNNWANEILRASECNGCAYEEVCDNCAANMMLFAEPGKQPLEFCKRTVYLVQHGVRYIPECD